MSKKSGEKKLGASTQQYLNIAEVKDDTVVMKDGTLRAVLLVSSINFALKSEDEHDPTAPLSKGWIAHLGRWPVPFAMGAVLSASSTSYRLWKHYKRHHNWAASARDSLDQALKKHLQRDVVSYFYRRLHYTRLLWVQRIYRRLVEKLDEAIATLEGIRAALAQADLDLGQEERALEDRLRAEGLRGGVLFRGLLSPEGARDIYEEIKPVDTHAAAERFLKEALAGSPWTAAPFAEIPALTAFCDKELARLDVLSPFKPDSEALFRCASDATRAFLSKLALKLSPPLATIEAARGEPPRGRHIAIVPEGALPPAPLALSFSIALRLTTHVGHVRRLYGSHECP